MHDQGHARVTRTMLRVSIVVEIAPTNVCRVSHILWKFLSRVPKCGGVSCVCDVCRSKKATIFSAKWKQSALTVFVIRWVQVWSPIFWIFFSKISTFPNLIVFTQQFRIYSPTINCNNASRSVINYFQKMNSKETFHLKIRSFIKVFVFFFFVNFFFKFFNFFCFFNFFIF